MNKPHKHAELIKAWADGAEIEYFGADCTWRTAEARDFDSDLSLRIKPEPKPDAPKIDEMFINWDDRKNEWFLSRSPLCDMVYKFKVEVAK
jgi:hypothetical protein